MNKLFLLFTIFSFISRNAIGSAVTDLDIRERAVGGLLKCAHSYNNAGITQPTGTPANGDRLNLPTTTDGSGQGAIISVTVASNAVAVNAITVVVAGSGYAAGDTLTVATALITDATGPLIITLQAADIADGSAKCGTTALTVNTGPSDATENAAKTISSVNNNLASGTGMQLTLTIDATGAVTAVEVTNGGTGYKVGDIISVDKADIPGASGGGISDADLVLNALTVDNIEDFGKVTVKEMFRDSEGNTNAFTTGTLKGYYATLSKHANQIQALATFNTGSLTPELGGVTDTALVSAKLSRQAFPVTDGLNILKLDSSVDGTYEIKLIKPDDTIKAIKTSKRNIEISYNPGEVGEFTCSAFADGSGLPTTRDNVKTGTGSVAKSVRTHNILPENRYNSLQMTLNGLSPSTIYDIHCFHLSHGIISNTAASVETDLGSLTGVSLVPADTIAGDFPTLTLKFTHEVALAEDATITLKLYKNYEELTGLTLTATSSSQTTTCGNQLTIQSGGQVIAGAHTCSADSNLLTITLDPLGSTIASAIASGTRGTEVEILITSDDTNLHLPDNPAAGTIVTFDVEVTGHGKLWQQDGWKTTSS